MFVKTLAAVLLFIVPFGSALQQQNENGMLENCLESGGGFKCLEKALELLENGKLPDNFKLLPGVSLIRANNSTSRGMSDIANRTISLDFAEMTEGLGKDSGRRRRRWRRQMFYLMVFTALIASKASALATSASLMIPLALKTIALIAAKALIVGKIAIGLATVYGLSKLAGSQPEQKTTEVIYDQHHDEHLQRADAALMDQQPAFLYHQSKPAGPLGSGLHLRRP